jgi:capsular polysaccharide transport system permease protein
MMVGGVEQADGTVLPTGESGDAPVGFGANPAMHDLLARLPKARGASDQGAEIVQPPLQGIREFRGATPDEPAAPEPAAQIADKSSEVRERPDPVEEAPRVLGLTLPQRVTHISTGRKVWFGVSFLAPVILGAIYLFLIAPDQYVTEFRFSVRVPVGQQGSMAAAGASTSALFGGNPTPGTDLLDNFTVADYVRSTQAATDLNAKLNIRAMYNKPFDPFSRVGGSANRERLAKFWKSMVYSDYDVTTGLAVVRVRAYAPEDSYAIANTLLSLSNDLVNSIGVRSQQDSVRFAQGQVDRIVRKMADLRSRLTTLRRDNAIISPSDGSQDIVSGNETLINQLAAAKSQIEGQIARLMAELHNANAPQIVVLHAQLVADDHQLRAAQQVVRGAGAHNLASTVGQFEELQAQLTNATTVLATAQNNLATAQAGADAQRLYLTTYVKPGLPESSTAPDRWMDLFLIMLISGMIWTIGLLFRNSILEHGR